MTLDELQTLAPYQRFVALLHDMLQLEHAELDFGLYRIMRSRRAVIERYFTEELPEQLAEHLEGLAASSKAGLERSVAEALSEIEAIGGKEHYLNEDGTLKADVSRTKGLLGEALRKYQTAKAQLADYRLATEQVSEVLLLVTDFFSRYYNEGDFIPAPEFGKREAYTLPYAGEDPFFHWATRGMHYVKTDNLFKDYRSLVPVEGLERGSYHVRFQLAEVEAVKDNNKAKRVLYPDIEAVTVDPEAREVTIPFAFRKPVKDQDAGNQNAAFDAAEPKLLAALTGHPPLHAALAHEVNGKTLLRRRLEHFAALGTRDFFVHGDLAGFLTRELDFFLKAEALKWADIEAGLTRRLGVLRAFRGVAVRIIAFLAQLETLQKRLFEKKRLVLSADYIVPIRHVPEDLWDEVLASESQLTEWREQLALAGEVSKDTLKTHPTLPLYTRHYDEGFKRRLLQTLSEAFGDLDEATDGLLINSENYGALRTIQAAYAGKVKVIYIDPPYNTGNDGFLYKDHYLHGTWLTMMDERLRLGRELLPDDGVLFTSIGDDEESNLKALLQGNFGEANFIANVIWQKVFAPKNTAQHFSDDHEYILVFAQSARVWRPFLLPRREEAESRYSNPDNDQRGPWASDNLLARNYYSKGEYEIVGPTGRSFRNPAGTYWRVSKEKFDELDADNRIWWGENQNNMPRLKRFLAEVKQGVVPQTLWKYEDVGHTQDAKKELLSIVKFERTEDVLNTVKPTDLIRRVLQIGTSADKPAWVLDYFVGSGTTPHAVIRQNVEDGGKRKFIAVEMGEYFDAMTYYRVMKAMFCPEWKDGKPKLETNLNGSLTHPEWMERLPRLVKVVKLESYEDALHNLAEAPSERERAYAESFSEKPVAGFPGKENAYLLRYFAEVAVDGNPAMLRPVNEGRVITEWEDPDGYALEVPAVGGSRLEKVEWIETALLWLGLAAKRYEEVEANGRLYRIMRAVKGDEPAAVVVRPLAGLKPHDDRTFLEGHLDGYTVYINGGAALANAYRLETALMEAMEAGVV
jgi:adenine-specific DNA-methyltransferase